MSVVFELAGSTLDSESWEELADQVCETLELEPYHEFLEDHHLNIMVEGSIRGVQVDLSDGDKEIRLGVAASRTDWRLAFALMRAALEEGGGRLRCEDGTEFIPDTLTDEAALERWEQDFSVVPSFMQSTLEKADVSWLPCGCFSLKVTQDTLAGEPSLDELEERLQEQFGKYAEAYPASIMQINTGLTLANWGQIPTLIPKVDAISFHAMVDSVGGIAPLADVREVMGDLIEEVGDDVYYFPAIDFDREPELLKQLKEIVRDVTEIEPSDPDSDLSTLDPRRSARIAEIASEVFRKLGEDANMADSLLGSLVDGTEDDPEELELRMVAVSAITKMLPKISGSPESFQDLDKIQAFLMKECELSQQDATAILLALVETTQHQSKKSGCMGPAGVLLFFCIVAAYLLF